VAEGTLFTYFKNKNVLLNGLYREIKLELADAMMDGFPRKKSIRIRLRHIWNRYTTWGVAHPAHHKVLSQLQLSDTLTLESKKAGSAPFLEIQTMAQDAVKQRLIRDIPQEFLSTTMDSLAQTTMAFMTPHPAFSEKFRALGFDMFWRAISKG
jgi:AcrR family transcriptional regulator